MFDEDKLFHPLEDKSARMFLEPSNYVALSLLKGHTAYEANQKSKNEIRKNILKLLANTDTDGDQSMLPLMISNYNHQICLGDGNATIK